MQNASDGVQLEPQLVSEKETQENLQHSTTRLQTGS